MKLYIRTAGIFLKILATDLSCRPRLVISSYLSGIEHVTAGGESGDDARVCNLQWFVDLQRQCKSAQIPFWFKQTGAKFINEKGLLVNVARMHQQHLADTYHLSVS